jgi:dTDP-D-glucose 4,6-dehydratase
MKLLLTAASTLLGTQVLNRFKQYYPEIQITAVDDLSDLEVLDQLFSLKNFDAVIHLAAAGKFNAEATSNLLDTANEAWAGFHLIKRFLMISADTALSNMALQSQYKDMTLVISNCLDCCASPDFPKEFIELASEQVKNNKSVPLFVSGQSVAEWFWVSDTACAIDVIFHQGESGMMYNIGGMNAWKSMEADMETDVKVGEYSTDYAIQSSSRTFMMKAKHIFSKLAVN